MLAGGTDGSGAAEYQYIAMDREQRKITGTKNQREGAEGVPGKIPPKKKRRGKDWLVDRLMLGGGIIVLGFTLFYGTVWNDLLNKKGTEPPTETTESILQETEPATELVVNENLYQSPYGEAGITKEDKDILNGFVMGDSVVTGIVSADDKISALHFETIDVRKTTYEQIKNVYDYLLENYNLEESEAVEQEELEKFREQTGLLSLYDAEVAYRGDRFLEEQSGSAQDFSSAFMLVLRKMGLDAYYINVEAEEGVHGDYAYVAVKSNGMYYIFDPASELGQMTNNAREDEERLVHKEPPTYDFFAVRLTGQQEAYQTGSILSQVTEFKGFAVVPPLKFDVMFSNGSHSVTGTMRYEGSGSAESVEGDLQVSMGDTINMAGTVSDTGGRNQWKLVAEIYDDDMNYLDEYEIYKDTTDSEYNETSFHTTEGGYIRLKYSVTDMYGRTCTMKHLFKID